MTRCQKVLLPFVLGKLTRLWDLLGFGRVQEVEKTQKVNWSATLLVIPSCYSLTAFHTVTQRASSRNDI